MSPQPFNLRLHLREPGAALSPAGDRAPRGGALLLRVRRHPLRRQRGTAGSIPGGHGGNSAGRAGALPHTERGLSRPGPGSRHRPKQPTGFAAHVAKKLRPAPDQPITGHTAHSSPFAAALAQHTSCRETLVQISQSIVFFDARV